MSDASAGFAVEEVTAAILAGGAGTRMDGQDKGLLALAGKPLVVHVGERLRGQATALLISANRNAEIYTRFGEVVSDAESGFRGPLAGIAAALAACRTDWLLTVPVDSPAPPSDLAARLGEAAQRAGSAVAVAHDGRRREPLFAIYRRDVACAAARAALERDLAVWRWQDELGAVEVDFSDHAAALANLNRPADFRAWEQAHD